MQNKKQIFKKLQYFAKLATRHPRTVFYMKIKLKIKLLLPLIQVLIIEKIFRNKLYFLCFSGIYVDDAHPGSGKQPTRYLRPPSFVSQIIIEF